MIIHEGPRLHILAPFGKDRAIYDKGIIACGLRPVKPVVKMPDKAPVKRPPDLQGF